MIQDQFTHRGLRIGLAGLVIAGGGVGGGVYLFGGAFSQWLVFALGLAGIGLVWVGAAVHIEDMVRQYHADAEARRQWIAIHGDPDRCDDPAEVEKPSRRGAASTLFLATAGAMLAGGCIALAPDRDPDAPTPETLKTLLAAHADRKAIEAALGKAYTRYDKGTASWDALISTCSSLPKSVAAHLDTYPRVMFYTTIWTQTWIFLDERDTMRHFIQGAQ